MAPAVAEQDHDARVEAGQARGVVYAAPGGVGKRFERRKQAEYKRPLRGNDATCDRIPVGFTLPEINHLLYSYTRPGYSQSP